MAKKLATLRYVQPYRYASPNIPVAAIRRFARRIAERFELEPVDQGRTRLTIRYQWSWPLSLLSGGSARLQAANELTQTVMAVEALAFDRS